MNNNRAYIVLVLVIALSVISTLAASQGKWDFCLAFATGVFAILRGDDLGRKDEKADPDIPAT